MMFLNDSIGSFQATYTDGSTSPITSDYTSEPALPYTFTNDDVANGKDFCFKYKDKTSSFHVNVVTSITSLTVDFNNTSKRYESSNITDITAGSHYKAKFIYHSGEVVPYPIGYIKFKKDLNSESTDDLYDVGYKDDTKLVNVTGTFDDSMQPIGNPFVRDKELVLNKDFGYGQNIIIYFTIAQNITTNFYIVN